MDKTARRQQILEQARNVFAKQGYHLAKIDDIVAAAGIARGTFYLYFEDKRAIFGEIVDGAFAKLAAAIARVDTKGDVDKQVRENIARIVEVLLDDRATTKILLADAVGLDPAFDRKLFAFYEEVGNLLEESLREGQDLGIVRQGNAKLYAMLSLGALKEVLFQSAVYEIDIDPAHISDTLYAFLSNGMLTLGGAVTSA